MGNCPSADISPNTSILERSSAKFSQASQGTSSACCSGFGFPVRIISGACVRPSEEDEPGVYPASRCLAFGTRQRASGRERAALGNLHPPAQPLSPGCLPAVREQPGFVTSLGNKGLGERSGPGLSKGRLLSRHGRQSRERVLRREGGHRVEQQFPLRFCGKGSIGIGST